MISLLHSVAVFGFTGTAWVAWSAAAAVSALIKRQSEESFRVRMNRKLAPVIAKAKWNFLASADRSRRFKGKRSPQSDCSAEDLMKGSSEPRMEHGLNTEREPAKVGASYNSALRV